MDTKGIDRYVHKCFNDSFISENRIVSSKKESIEYLMIKNKNGKWQFYPFIKTKYKRVEAKTIYRLHNNIEKNFGVIYGDTDILRCGFYMDGQIDYNYTEMMFRYNNSNFSLSIYDDEIDTRPEGKYIYASRLEKLIINFANLYKISADTLLADDKLILHLPDEYQYNWNLYSKLYEKTFNVKLGKGYEVICSDGIIKL